MTTKTLNPKHLTTALEPAQSSQEGHSPEAWYRSVEPEIIQVEDAGIAVRRFGDSGRPLVFIHGFPVHGFTWRALLPELASQRQCIVLDLPGLGDSRWHPHTDFSFRGQARRLSILLEELQLNQVTLVAHDTGATIGRLVALQKPELIEHLIMINTEIPGHRPPYIRLHQLASLLPWAGAMFRLLLQTPLFLHSPMAFRGFYADRNLLSKPGMLDPYVHPLTTKPERTKGMFGYLNGIDWDVIDELAKTHADIKAQTHLIWGEQDETFPLHYAEQMRDQFKPVAPLYRINNAALMPQEEQPEQVLCAIKQILEL